MSEALIWGASGGIGAALSSHLKDNGWRVYGAARNINNIPKAIDLGIFFDAANPSSIDQAALQIAQETDGLDLVVYAAGSLEADLFRNTSQKSWAQVFALNFNGRIPDSCGQPKSDE